MAPYIVQAITTKYIGPTNTRAARIKAKAAAGSVTVSYDQGLGIERNHALAAKALADKALADKALADKFEWKGIWFQGGMPDECGYVFVSMGGDPDDWCTCAAFTTDGRH